MRGSVLLADVSGFTRLTEKLVARFGERRGPEELLERLNRVYDALLEPLHAAGGSVVYFSGDSITCFLAGESGPAMIQVGLAMQMAMRQLTSAASEDFGGVGLKVAVGYGEVLRAEVGDPEIQLLEALGGEVVYEVAAVEEATKLGEVALTSALYERVRDEVKLASERTLASGTKLYAIEALNGATVLRSSQERIVELAPELFRPRIHPLVLARLESGSDELIAELRLTSPLFVQFTGIDWGSDPEAREKLSRFVTLVQRVAARYEGAVLSLTMGEKGSYLYVNFGALLSHPDDAARAVGAALEIVQLRDSVPELTSIRAGVSSGRVRVGAYGAKERRVYGALGDDVNLAARLMMLSDSNQVTVSEAAVLAAKGAFEFESRGELPVKGKSSPVPIFRAVRRGLSSSAPPSLDPKADTVIVGRVIEKQVLEAFASSDPSSESRVLFLEGEAGIGKSQLLAHLHKVLRQRHISVLSCAGNSIEKSTPYHVFSRAIASLLRMHAAPSDSAARRAYLQAQLPNDPLVRRRAPLLRAVLGVEWPDNDFTADLDGEVRKTNTDELLLSLFKTESERRRTALVLEDAHWFDSASWELLRRLRAEISGMFLAVTSRPESDMPTTVVTAEQVKLFLGESGQSIRLGSFDRTDVEALLAHRLRVKNLPSSVIDLIVEQAGGHPFYSEELAYALRDASLLILDGNEARLAPGAAQSLLEFRPGSVEAAITSRVDRLEPEFQTALKFASVAGREFETFVLEQVLPQAQELPKKLEKLVERGFLEFCEEGVFRFKHALTQEAVYGLMLYAQRQKIHAELGHWLERERGTAGAHMPPLLAHHFECAGEFERAVPYFEKAGEHALRANANREALGFFRRALELAPDASLPRRAHWMRCVGDAEELLGNLKGSQTSSEEALRLLGRAPPSNMASLILRLYGQIFYRMFHSQVPSLGKPESEEEREALMEAARAHLRLTQVYYYTGQNFQMLLSGLYQLNLAARAGESRELAQAYGIMAAVASTIPLPSLSKSWGDAGYAVAEHLADRPTKAFVQLRQSFYSLCVCDFGQACRDLESSAEISKDIGDYRSLEMNYAMLGATHEIRGDFETSKRFWEAARASGEERGAVQSIGFGLQGLGLARYRMEEGGEPLSILEAAEKILEEAGSTTHQYQMRGVLAEAHADLGNHERALHFATEAERLLGYARPTTFYILSGYAGVAHALLGVWDQDRSSAVLAKRVRKAVGVLRSFSSAFSFGEGRAALYCGRLLVRKGREKKAKAVFTRGLDAAKRRKTPYDEGLLSYELGILTEGEARRALLDASLAILEGCNAQRAAAKVREAREL